MICNKCSGTVYGRSVRDYDFCETFIITDKKCDQCDGKGIVTNKEGIKNETI